MGKVVKINITLPDEELRIIDDFVREKGETRSGLILRALQLFMEESRRMKAEEARRREKEDALREILRLRDKAGGWDGVAEIRRWRDRR